MWLEFPLEKLDQDNNFMAEILIVQKDGYFLEEIKENMPHIEKLLSVRYPNKPCQSVMKQKGYPIQILADN